MTRPKGEEIDAGPHVAAVVPRRQQVPHRRAIANAPHDDRMMRLAGVISEPNC
jgi:hypothetical protein